MIPKKSHADIQFEDMLKKLNLLKEPPTEPLYAKAELWADQRIGYIEKIKKDEDKETTMA